MPRFGRIVVKGASDPTGMRRSSEGSILVRSLSNRGFDVLVQSKQVGRVVLVLQRDKPSVVVAVGGPYPRRFLRVQMIDVNFTGREGLHGRPELTGPLDMTCRFPSIEPLRDDVII